MSWMKANGKACNASTASPYNKAKKRAIVRMNHNLLLFKTMRLHQFVQVRTNKGAAARILFLVHHPVGLPCQVFHMISGICQLFSQFVWPH